jgi:hypothetical protein
METLSILLSSSGNAGEIFFIGALTGLASWGLVSLMNRKSEKKNKLANQFVIQMQETLKEKDGVLKVLNELIEYFNKTYTMQISQVLETGVLMFNEKYEAGIAIAFGDRDIVFISFLNRKTGNGVSWTYDITKSQNEIIKKIDPDIKKNLFE